jgi:hypothetical protein
LTVPGCFWLTLSGGLERLRQHGDVGAALRQVGEAAGGAAGQDGERHPGKLLDPLLVRPHQAVGHGGRAVDPDLGSGTARAARKPDGNSQNGTARGECCFHRCCLGG